MKNEVVVKIQYYTTKIPYDFNTTKKIFYLCQEFKLRN